jgi:DNA-directed RNA polymerase
MNASAPNPDLTEGMSDYEKAIFARAEQYAATIARHGGLSQVQWEKELAERLYSEYKEDISVLMRVVELYDADLRADETSREVRTKLIASAHVKLMAGYFDQIAYDIRH